MRTGRRRLNLLNRVWLRRNKVSYNASNSQENGNLDPTILSEALHSFRASCILGQSTLACDAAGILTQSILQDFFKNGSNWNTMYYSAYESIYDDAGSCPGQSIVENLDSAYYTPATSVRNVGSRKLVVSRLPDNAPTVIRQDVRKKGDNGELQAGDLIRDVQANYQCESRACQSQQEPRELETFAKEDEDSGSDRGLSANCHNGAELRRVHSAADGYRYVLFPVSTTPSVSYLSSMSSISLQAHRIFDSVFSDDDRLICLGFGVRTRDFTVGAIRSIRKSIIAALSLALRSIGLVGKKVKHFLICSVLCFVVYASGPA
ncbi:hypothetical protein V1517DRAFT_329324 [Lipomyces orientalis]|uniref:Uncharacterized protein n=1 Tax=Lipomyces orientalis TaxID=1233043 RepID=A0ACC3TI82_9ASCO